MTDIFFKSLRLKNKMEISEGQISNLEDQNVEISQNRGGEKYIIIKKKKKKWEKT